ATVPNTRKPCEAIVVRKPEYRVLSIAQPPLPQTITGNVSFFGKASRAVGRNTRWPGDPNAPSDVTLYGPGSASGAPSSGNDRSIISRVTPGGWARQTPAPVSSATAAAMIVLCISLLRSGCGDRDYPKIEMNRARVKPHEVG